MTFPTVVSQAPSPVAQRREKMLATMVILIAIVRYSSFPRP